GKFGRTLSCHMPEGAKVNAKNTFNCKIKTKPTAGSLAFGSSNYSICIAHKIFSHNISNEIPFFLISFHIIREHNGDSVLKVFDVTATFIVLGVMSVSVNLRLTCP